MGRVCSDHYCVRIPAKLYDSDNVDWVPSLKLGYNTTSAHPEYTMGRYEG